LKACVAIWVNSQLKQVSHLPYNKTRNETRVLIDYSPNRKQRNLSWKPVIRLVR